MKLIETKTLGSAAASIEFTSIPQTGTDLFLLISGRHSDSTIAGFVSIAFNGSTANFTTNGMFGNGSTAAVFTSPTNWAGEIAGNSSTANTFGNSTVYIANYTGSTAKNFVTDGVGENNATTANQSIGAGIWNNTAAITSLSITSSSGNLAAGSTASLYTITKGTDGIVVVS